MLFYVPLIILTIVLGAQLWLRFFAIRLRNTNFLRTCEFLNKKFFRQIFIFSILLIVGLCFYQSYQQHQAWSYNELSKFLLPPHQSINYFIFYSFMKFFLPYLISLAFALLLVFTNKKLNEKGGERFFYDEEIWIAGLAIFLSNWPGWLFYFTILIAFYFLISLFYSLFFKKMERISMYWLWLPIAIFGIIISNYWLQNLSLWSILKI